MYHRHHNPQLLAYSLETSFNTSTLLFPVYDIPLSCTNGPFDFSSVSQAKSNNQSHNVWNLFFNGWGAKQAVIPLCNNYTPNPNFLII
jgi:hypothetical protein